MIIKLIFITSTSLPEIHHLKKNMLSLQLSYYVSFTSKVKCDHFFDKCHSYYFIFKCFLFIFQYMRDGGGAERALPIATDP